MVRIMIHDTRFSVTVRGSFEMLVSCFVKTLLLRRKKKRDTLQLKIYSIVPISFLSDASPQCNDKNRSWGKHGMRRSAFAGEICSPSWF